MEKIACQWIDLCGPTVQDLDRIAVTYGFPSQLLMDCLDPKHLPKIELTSEYQFLLLRFFDQGHSFHADSTQELTRKVILLRNEKVLLTIHRSPLEIVDRVRQEFSKSELNAQSTKQIMIRFFELCVESFDRPIEEELDTLESFEMKLFGAESDKRVDLKTGYLIKRRSFVFRRLLRGMLEISKVFESDPQVSSWKRELKSKRHLKEDFEKHLHVCEEIHETAMALLSMQVSIDSQKTNEAAQKTNEVMRILTIFSMFLLPLNVITGIYGMNFENMPELKWPGGYYFALLLMTICLAVTFTYFRRKKWL